MDTNTSPFMPEEPLRRLAKSVMRLRVNDYPDTSYLSLRKRLSEYCNKKIDNFVVTNGGDEALDIVVKTYLDPAEKVVIPYPTYSMFRISSEIMGATTLLVSRNKKYDIDLETIKKKIDAKTKIIFLCNPNNPTGNSDSLEEVRALLEFARRQIVVIDEAYFEFSGKSAAGLTSRFDNLAIVRTFSKAFSMAGVRVGYIIASRETVNELNLVRPPNSLGVISLFLAEQALVHRKSMDKNVRELVSERKRLYSILSEDARIETFPSEANFLLLNLKNVPCEKVHRALMKKGLVLRNFSGSPGIENCLRVTLNTPKVNDLFLQELGSALAKYS